MGVSRVNVASKCDTLIHFAECILGKKVKTCNYFSMFLQFGEQDEI